ncbi:MAG: FtsQ-type POTRA domain-containing protein [Acidobacteria bacterium]|nr:MAG: FtsQ-type POTRA domain-containing protein [Acidobacteriota bacterium]
MRHRWVCCVLTSMVIGLSPVCLAEVVDSVRIQGNFKTPDAEVLRLAGVSVGADLGNVSIPEVEKRLLESGRFESVRVVKRYPSLVDTERVVLLIEVREKQTVKSRFMMMPILSGSDEYGLAYGARFSAIDLLNTGERISFPLTWGGVRQAAAEIEFPRKLPGFASLFAGGGINWKENPHFELGDLRKEFLAGARNRLGPVVYEISGGWTDVGFGELDDQFLSYGAQIALDTRQDVNLPRDAVYLGFGWRRMALANMRPDFNLYRTDLRGYKGLWGQAILAAQVLYDKADGPLPDYERPFLGGATTLRGHQPGEFVGDNRVVSSVELRLPVTSPLAIYHAGFDAFWDSGAVFNDGQSLRDSQFEHGVGVGAFILIAGFGLKVDLAHDLGGSFRVHFSTGFRF